MTKTNLCFHRTATHLQEWPLLYFFVPLMSQRRPIHFFFAFFDSLLRSKDQSEKISHCKTYSPCTVLIQLPRHQCPITHVVKIQIIVQRDIRCLQSMKSFENLLMCVSNCHLFLQKHASTLWILKIEHTRLCLAETLVSLRSNFMKILTRPPGALFS